MMKKKQKKYVQGHGLDADNDKLALFSLLLSIQVLRGRWGLEGRRYTERLSPGTS